jgi:hypothetical protein
MKKTGHILILLMGLTFISTQYTPLTSSSKPLNETRVLRAVKWGPEPVEVTEIRINSKPVSFDRSFVSNEDDWIRELSFKVKNTSNKDISYVRFELQFPLNDIPKRAFYVQVIEYGGTPVPGSGKTIRPGETVRLTCHTDVSALKKVVRDKGQGEYLKMNAALLSTEVIDFQDKTSWLAGQWMRFDDKNKKWIEMDHPQPEESLNPDVAFQPASFKPVPMSDCYRGTHDSINCTLECGCGGAKSVTVAGDPGAGNSLADKLQFCCTQNGISCFVAYTGITPGCV